MPALVAIVGGGNAGKTTLIEKLIPVLRQRGYRVGTVKHVAHHFALDPSGKDSWRHRAAGAETVVVDAGDKLLLFKTVPPDEATDRLRKTAEKYFDDMDVVLAEGYKSARVPKIEVFREAVNSEPVCLGDPDLLAFVSDADISAGVLRFGPDDILAIADLIEKKIR